MVEWRTRAARSSGRFRPAPRAIQPHPNMQAPYSAPVPPSPSVRCPKCGSELEGEFTFVDDVRCPVCRKVFFPPLPVPAPGARLLPKGVFRPKSVFAVSAIWGAMALSHVLALAVGGRPEGVAARAVVPAAMAVLLPFGIAWTHRLAIVLSVLGVTIAPLLSVGLSVQAWAAENGPFPPPPAAFVLLPAALTLLLNSASLWVLTRPRVSWWFRLPDKVPLP